MYEREVIQKILKYIDKTLEDKSDSKVHRLGERGHWYIRGPIREVGIIKGRYIDAINYAVRSKKFYQTEYEDLRVFKVKQRIEKMKRHHVENVKWADKQTGENRIKEIGLLTTTTKWHIGHSLSGHSHSPDGCNDEDCD